MAVEVTIRCHPCAPVDADELELWLEREAARLRAEVPHAIVRLSRLTQSRPDGDLRVGWLLEVEVLDGAPRLDAQRVSDAIRDMRLLGLQPTLLTPDRGGASKERAVLGANAA